MSATIDPAKERAWNPRVAVPDFQRQLEAQAAHSARTRAALAAQLDVRYGAGPLQTLDLFFPQGGPQSGNLAGRGKRRATGRPVAAFLHGGYWRALDKSAYSYFAEPIVAAGGIAAVVNYDLCPAVTIDDIVKETVEAFAWLSAEAEAFGGDPERICGAGHSAGAHLLAMALIHDWEADDLPPDIVKAACLVSGVYDIAVVMDTSVNADVRLDAVRARRNSPLLLPPPGEGDLLIVAGERETPEFIAQSAAYAEHVADGGAEADFTTVAGEDHFSICHRFADADHLLTQFLLDQFG